MKRFSPYTAYQRNGQTRYRSIAPDGKKLDSATWHDDRINEIRSIFLKKNKENQYAFKQHQQEVITSILSGNDTFVVLPTGSGKSLSFQAPSVFFPGITLVVTPLVALIENQAETFNRRAYPIYHPRGKNYYEDIRFQAIYPGMDGLTIQEMFSRIRKPPQAGGREVQYKFLYVSPERLANPKFIRILEAEEKDGLRIDHIVIDEVHCMSQWGFEFRESYLCLADFISRRPVRPIISAFTATVTPKDIAEIKGILGFPTDKREYAKKKYHEVIHVQKRENLSLRVIPCNDFAEPESGASPQTRLDTLLHILEENRTRVCIIYRTTAIGVDELYQTLKDNELLKDRLAKYHAQMSDRAKKKNKNLFLGSHDENLRQQAAYDKPPKPGKNIMIATKAFGMGIDKSDISMIIHYDVPRSLEDYYQEVGRAGRDIEKVPIAECFLLYSVGPRKAKGSLHYTIRWVTSGKDASESGCMPISSQFSEKMRETIYFWSYYRLSYVMKYCNIIKNHPDEAHNFVIRYLKNQISAEQTVRDLDFFYSYIEEHYKTDKEKEEEMQKGVQIRLFRGDEALRFLRPYSQEEPQAGRNEAELKRLMGEVNELHINNTFIANLMRYHPEEYEIGKPYVLPEGGVGQEWKSKKNKRVKGDVSQTLRKSDMIEDSAFFFAPQPESCGDELNAAWDDRPEKSHDATVLFTVDKKCTINGVWKIEKGCWRLLEGEDALRPYARYLGSHVKGLFPLKDYGWWRRAMANPPAQDSEEKNSPFVYARGARRHDLHFTLRGGEKLSPFDLSVLDAVYSIEAAQKKAVYVQTIWEILTGRNPRYSSREKLAFRTAIQNSIDKMRAMTISITDSQCGFSITNAPFLPLLDKPKGQKGYAYSATPPLFLYAEELNGQIIKVPVSLLNVDKIETAALWKEQIHAEFQTGDAPAFVGERNHPFGRNVKALILDANLWPQLAHFLSPRESRRIEQVWRHPYSFSPSIENALLCCYLVHRVFISRNRKRGSFIRLSTIRRVTGIREDSALFHRKVAAILAHYQRMGAIYAHYFYISGMKYRLDDGGVLTDNAYFSAKPAEAIKYWRDGMTNHVVVSDFILSWSLQKHKALMDDNSNFNLNTAVLDAVTRDGRSLSEETKRTLATASLGRMDGVVLMHNAAK